MTEDNSAVLKKKDFNYRGKTIEELKNLEIREFAKLLKSNERRTALRQTAEIQKFISRALKKAQKNKSIRTHSRYLIIVPQMIGLTIYVFNGKTFSPVQITGEMLGHRLGEFSITRLKVKHGAAGIGATRGSASLSVK